MSQTTVSVSFSVLAKTGDCFGSGFGFGAIEFKPTKFWFRPTLKKRHHIYNKLTDDLPLAISGVLLYGSRPGLSESPVATETL